MAPAKVKMGILGAGSMGLEHAESCQGIAGVEIAGVFSRKRERADAVAKKCNARAVTEASALIDDPSITAIDVCVPSANHREFVVAALKKGKHVFCETPFALNAEDAQAMVSAARESGRILMVGLLMRSIAHYEFIHRAAASGEYGKLLSVMAYRLGSYMRVGGQDHKDHYSEPSTELMTFDFDFCNWLMNVPARVSASAAYLSGDTPGEISALIEYEDGGSATVLASGILPSSCAFSAGFRVLFERGAFELRNVFQNGPPQTTYTCFPENGAPAPVAVTGRNPYEHQLRLFVDRVRGEGDSSLLDAGHALDALALSLATQQSLREHRTIDVAPIRSRLGT